MNKRLAAPAMLMLITAGCVEQQIDKSFRQVQEMAHERLSQELIWNESRAGEQRIADSLVDLLQGELTADQAVSIALLNNRRLQATYSEVGIASARLVEAYLAKNPVLTGQIRFVHGKPLWELEVVQDFLDILLIPLAASVAEAELEAAKNRVTAEVLDVAMETRRTFYQYQARIEFLQLWQSILLAAESEYRMAVELRRAGNISELTLAREQSMYEQLKLDVAEQELAGVRDRERLNVLMGLWGGATHWRASPKLPELPETAGDLDDVERRAIDNSLDLKAALYNITSQAQQLGLQSIQAAVPQLQLGGAVESERPTEYRLDKDRRMGRTQYELKDFSTQEWQAGPAFSLPVPLWNWGQAAFGVARMELLRRWNLYTALAIDIRATARETRFHVATAHQRALFTRNTLVAVADNVFDETQLQYNAMTLGVFDLLRAKREQLEAQQRYIAAVQEYWHARTDLDQLLLGSARHMANREGGAGRRDIDIAGGMQGTLQRVRQQTEAGGQQQGR